jgi:hypothetical protein
VPLKFSLCTNSGANRSSATITVTATQLKRTSSPTSTTTPSPNLLTGNLKWKYDPKLDGTGGGYQYNLKTSGLSTGSYQLVFTVQGDPNTHNAPFSVKP